MIGIIGYGMVGRAVKHGFSKTQVFYSDPKYNTVSVKHLCKMELDAIFVCVPTPSDGTDYALLKSVLQEIKDSNYIGLVVVKSTVLPEHLAGFDVLYNPEFLTRSTSLEDFVNPEYLIIGGRRGQELLDLYARESTVDTSNCYLVDIPTASLIKYTMNTFYALKVTYMNSIYDVAQDMGADYATAAEILSTHPWMGSHHFAVPGPDGQRGFGGPCLPKDTQALTHKYKLALLDTVLELNKGYRNGN
jgi:UDPglucose 6-dehydrogenase